MPELPEVETIRRRLAAALLGSRVEVASLHRRDMLRTNRGRAIGRSILEGASITALHRHGKQLAIEGDDGRIVVVHLGMSGRLLLGDVDAGARSDEGRRPTEAAAIRPPHTHAAWILERNGRRRTLIFVDPRRFGWLRALDGRASLELHWSTMGPDALELGADPLRISLSRSNRPIKSLLLDQQVVAGLGNIYVDELLHRIGVHPMTPSSALVQRATELIASIQDLLGNAIAQGGSTIRDYRDPSGEFGSFQQAHQVYGRHGEPCLRCAEATTPSLVRRMVIAGRGTWYCPCCQATVRGRESRRAGLSTDRKQPKGVRRSRAASTARHVTDP